MKRTLAWMLAVLMLCSIALTSVAAEGENAAAQTDATTSATQKTQPDRDSEQGKGRKNQTSPSNNQQQKPGKQPQQGSTQTAPDAQAPNNSQQTPDNQSQGNLQQNREPHGNRAKRGTKSASSFDALLKKGLITQETYDAVMQYLKARAAENTQTTDDAKAAESAQATDDAKSAESVQATDDAKAAESAQTTDDAKTAKGTKAPKSAKARPGKQAPKGTKPTGGTHVAADSALLKELLDAGVITQEIFDAITAAQTGTQAALAEPMKE